MAEDLVYKQEFIVRSLPTSSVTLFPARAQVIRDINDITLRPGANEISIYGLTPTADENTIKVDGKGSATITEMTVSLIPNREKYEDVYPEESDDEESDEPEDDDDSFEQEDGSVKATVNALWENDKASKQASEDKACASSRYYMLEGYARTIEKDRPADLGQCLAAYIEEREKTYHDHYDSDIKLKALESERKQLSKKKSKALQASIKEKKKAAKEKRKALERKQRARQEKLEAKQQLKRDRIEFWPRKVYRVVLSLETNVDMTPASSRRGSVDTLMERPMSDVSAGCQISLSLSYITEAASWSPRYDLSLDTPSNTGLIIYRAEFYNATSETWKDAKVTLSTSQTSFQGLGETIPSMQPWHIRLFPKNKGKSPSTSAIKDDSYGALLSTHETQYKQRNQTLNKASEPRNALFGLGDHSVSQSSYTSHGNLPVNVQVQQQLQQMHVQKMQQQQRQMQGQQMQQRQMQSLFQDQSRVDNLQSQPVPQASHSADATEAVADPFDTSSSITIPDLPLSPPRSLNGQRQA